MSEGKPSKASLMRSYAPGELIFSAGDQSREMFVVRKGKVRIFKQTGSAELTLAVLNPGESFGEMAILEQVSRSASAAAVEDTELVVVGEDSFENMLRDRPDITFRLLKKLSARLRDANKQIEALTAHGGAARIVHILKMWSPQDASGAVHLPGVKPDELWRASGTPREVFGEVLHGLGAAGIARFSADGLTITLPTGLDDYLEYLDLKRVFDAATTRELEVLQTQQSGQAEPAPAQDSNPEPASPEHERRSTYQRFVALRGQFGK